MLMAHSDSIPFHEKHASGHNSDSSSYRLYEEASSLITLAAAHKKSDQRDESQLVSGIDHANGLKNSKHDRTDSRRQSEDQPKAKRDHGDNSEVVRRILASASSKSGQHLWSKHSEDTRDGGLGCAISVATVLNDAGIKVGEPLSVNALESTLKHRGWQAYPLDQAKPGDVAVGHNTENGTNHVGIISSMGTLWNNSSKTFGSPRWANEPITLGLRPHWLINGFDQRYVLRPPG